MNRLRDIFSRLYADFLMPSRLQEYGQILETALEAGYRFDTIRNVWQQLRDDDSGVPDRTLILRHDVDTDPGTAARKLAIETALGIHCSYFFRLCTVDIGLMQRIEALGGEASYHYEEIATFAKAERIKQREEILSRLPEIRACFADNLERLRRDSGLGMTTVASHGDFANKKLGLANTVLLQDKTLREATGVELEVYDEAFTSHIDSSHTDRRPPQRWYPSDPLDAIGKRVPVIAVLTHPRQWRANWTWNLRDNMRRAWEGLRYAI